MTTKTSTADLNRRGFFAWIINGIVAAIGGVVGVVLGGAVINPQKVQSAENWLPAGNLADLHDDEPTPVLLRAVRQDGYRDVVDRRTVFLVKTGGKVLALDSTCTHLGCRVAWDPATQFFKCPCHGGVFEPTGAVKAGPPPAPLPRLATRIDGDQVLVQV